MAGVDAAAEDELEVSKIGYQRVDRDRRSARGHCPNEEVAWRVDAPDISRQGVVIPTADRRPSPIRGHATLDPRKQREQNLLEVHPGVLLKDGVVARRDGRSVRPSDDAVAALVVEHLLR